MKIMTRVTTHAPAHKTVLDRSGQRVADVKATGDIGRGCRDDEDSLRLDFAVGCQLGLEVALLEPPLVPGRLDRDRVVTSGHRHGHICTAIVSI